MKNLFKTIVLFFLISLTSCSDDNLEKVENNQSTIISNLKNDTRLKEKFAVALAKALNENLELREFIKIEALKKVTKDYDVVYQLVKDQVPSNAYSKSASAETVRAILLKFFDTEAELKEIEEALPLLTIFVPDLQGGSFSALNWDTANQIPFVAVRSKESDDVKIIKFTGEEHILEAKYMPDFPVVVVKDNERLISSKTNSQFEELDTRILSAPADIIKIRYIDKNFDIAIVNTPVTIANAGPRVPQIQADAYNVFGSYTPGGWQRDYIYYGLTPVHTQGGYNQNYVEQLTSFSLSGSPSSAYTSIATAQDPMLRDQVFMPTNEVAGWTDGSYEFKIRNAYGAKNSNLGAQETKLFGVNPSDLFSITYEPVTGAGIWIYLLYKRPVITGLKTIDLYNGAYYGTRVEFSGWDLNNFCNQWLLSFEESDTPTEITTSVSQTNKFNANFSIEPSTGILKKIGLKFGASIEQSLTNTYTSKHTDISDDLGTSVISFWDNVVNLNPATNTLVPRTYSTGKVVFEFRPMLAQ